MYCFHVLAWVLLLCPSASVIPKGFTFCGLLWPHGDSLYGILPVLSQKLWTGQESRPQDIHRHLGSHSRSGQGPQIKSVTL